MSVEHHALSNDLPEFKHLIHELKMEDAHFARLMGDYHALTTEIEKLENANSPVSDESETAMKQKRVRLKDELLGMLTERKKRCCGRAGCACGGHE